MLRTCVSYAEPGAGGVLHTLWCMWCANGPRSTASLLSASTSVMPIHDASNQHVGSTENAVRLSSAYTEA